MILTTKSELTSSFSIDIDTERRKHDAKQSTWRDFHFQLVVFMRRHFLRFQLFRYSSLMRNRKEKFVNIARTANEKKGDLLWSLFRSQKRSALFRVCLWSLSLFNTRIAPIAKMWSCKQAQLIRIISFLLFCLALFRAFVFTLLFSGVGSTKVKR